MRNSSRCPSGLLAIAVLLSVGSRVDAQVLPSEPLVLADGRMTLSADISATYSCSDDGSSRGPACGADTGFFNYTDYEHSALRLFSFGLSASVSAGRHLSILGEIRTDNAEVPQPYGLYVRVRPWPSHRFDLQVGLIPPTFGAFSRRRYPPDNLLIGYPLAYQYLTSLRPDALPASADDLLRMRGRGWLSSFPLGNTASDRGVPLVSALRWDTGAQAHATMGMVDAAFSVTTGTLAHPLVRDDNSGKQLSGRVALQPTPGLLMAISGAKGPFVADRAIETSGLQRGTQEVTQTSVGGDLEYSRGYYLVRVETVMVDWRLPVVASPLIRLPLRAVSTFVEGRYRLRPGLYAAARFDHLGFSTVKGTSGWDTWDAPVTRIEIGAGYSIQRNIVIKASFQRNTRDTPRLPWLNVAAAQVVMWF